MACFQSCSIGHQFAISIVLLSIVLLSPGHALPRPAPIVGALSAPTQLLLSELLAAERAPAEDSVYYSEQLVSTLRTLSSSSYCQLCIALTHRIIHNSSCTTTCNINNNNCSKLSRCRHSITSSTSGPRCVICCWPRTTTMNPLCPLLLQRRVWRGSESVLNLDHIFWRVCIAWPSQQPMTRASMASMAVTTSWPLCPPRSRARACASTRPRSSTTSRKMCNVSIDSNLYIYIYIDISAYVLHGRWLTCSFILFIFHVLIFTYYHKSSA